MSDLLPRQARGMFSVRRLFIGAAGLTVSVFLCWLLFRNTEWEAVGSALAGANPVYLAGCAAFFIGTYFARTYRMKFILEMRGDARARTVFDVLAITWFARTLFPPIPLPVFQAALFQRLLPRPFTQCLGGATADMLLEGLSVSILLVGALLFVPTANGFRLPESLAGSSESTAISAAVFDRGILGVSALVLAQIFAVVLIYRYRKFFANVARRWSRRAGDAFESSVDNLHIFDDRRKLRHVLLGNLLHWICYTGCMACLLEAFGIAWPWYGPFLLVALIGVALSQPGAPGFVGHVHVAMVAGVVLIAPNHPVDEIKALAIYIHLVYVGVVVLFGVACLARTLPELRARRARVAIATD